MCAMPSERSRGRRGLALRLAVLLVVPAVAAVLTAWWHPRGPDWTALRAEVSRVSVAEVAGVADVLWVDARDPEAFAAGHAPGAVNLSEEHWEEQLPGLLDVWEPGRRVVVYCDGAECLASRQVALRIRRELALEDVAVLTGGWPAWLEGRP